MTETEWLESKEPVAMLALVDGRKRKLRLFACACCRQAWNPFVPELARRVVAAAEMAADGLVGRNELDAIYATATEAAAAAFPVAPQVDPGYPVHTLSAAAATASPNASAAAVQAALRSALAASDAPAPVVGPPGGRTGRADFDAERAIQADLLRDIFGNPFRSSGLEPEWFTDTVVSLARQMYESREFGGMPILADALQDAGCDDADILTHCRDDREHVRGCWVVDLLLGKS